MEEALDPKLITNALFRNSLQTVLIRLPYADTLVYSAECLKYKQPGILNKVIQTSHKEKVIQKNLEKWTKIL